MVELILVVMVLVLLLVIVLKVVVGVSCLLNQALGIDVQLRQVIVIRGTLPLLACQLGLFVFVDFYRRGWGIIMMMMMLCRLAGSIGDRN